MDLEEIAKKLEEMNITEKASFLHILGRKAHIEIETGESTKLVEENPERFIKIGTRTTPKEGFEGTEEEYLKTCISDAIYLYEEFPIIFEFYDELENGIVQQEMTEPVPQR
jgi:hypothetical protein